MIEIIVDYGDEEEIIPIYHIKEQYRKIEDSAQRNNDIIIQSV